MLTILVLKVIRRLKWAKNGEEWSWKRYEYVLYQVYHKRLDRLANKSTKKLIKFYEFLSHGGFPENPACITQEYLELVNDYCNGSIW